MCSKKFVRFGLLLLAKSFISSVALGQNLLVDQGSGTLEEPVFQGSVIPNNSLSQSFTPALPAIGFVQLRGLLIQPGATTVTLVVNLREGAFNGSVISTTTPITLPQFTSLGTFYFPDNVPIVSGQRYFFEPVLQSVGSLSIIDKPGDPYPQGELWGNGVPSTVVDLWFREGMVVPVPEPGVLWLMVLLGTGAALACRRRAGKV